MQIVTINDENHQVLLDPAKPVEFPLDPQTRQAFQAMEQFVIQHEQETGISGMAAPQMGHSLRIIFFHAKKEWAMYDREIEEDIPLHAAFNPSYHGVEEEGMEKGLEGCFSIPDVVLEVYRYKTIQYRWQDFDGEQHSQVMRGFTARIIQHEIDHLDGVLHSTLMRDDCRSFTIDEYIQMRAEMIARTEQM